jgi:hypothetical protein
MGDKGAADTPGGPGTGAVTPGQVTVTTNNLQYTSADTIVVTVANGLPNGVLAADHQSNCTTVTVERQDGSSWQPQNPCRLMIATRLVPLDASTATTVQLQPQPAWAAGTYRIAFTFMRSRGAASSTIYSTSFMIG